MIQHFVEKVDLRSRKSILAYLEGHPVHSEMWRASTLANCIKLNHLPIPRDLVDAAYDLISDEAEYTIWCDFEMHDKIKAFNEETGLTVYSAGRSSGWLECYGNRSNPITLRDDVREAETFGDLKYLAQMCLEFDAFCDGVLNDFIDFVACYKYGKEQEQIEAEREAAALLDLPFPAVGV